MRIELMDASVLINVIGIRMEANDQEAIRSGLASRLSVKTTIVLPVAAIVETAQHVQRISEGQGHHRRQCAERLRKVVEDAMAGEAPWRFIGLNWDKEFVSDFFNQKDPTSNLVDALSARSHEAGDLLLISEFRRLRSSYPRNTVDMGVWTLDRGLRAAVELLL